jgi:hypothetical protein
MRRNEPKKKIPSSGVMKMVWVGNKLERSFNTEPYPQQQKEIEKVILIKFVKYIRRNEHRNIQVSSIKEIERDKEPPDFIYKEKGQNIGAELMELVTQQQAVCLSVNKSRNNIITFICPCLKDRYPPGIVGVPVQLSHTLGIPVAIV